MSVWLNVKRELAAANGNMQFFICVKAPTKKRVAELLNELGCNCSLSRLNTFCGLWVNERYSFQPPEDETIYFHNDHHNTPHRGEWLKLSDWKR